ncbi:HEPN domain-containing protein [Shinella sp. G-2]|uniref:HEPN domain-containing protein n=1 Tax=Shinella sp. G-2 TaxID=3133141 RepID=UPI003D055B25
MSLAIENRFREVEKLVVAAQTKGLDPEVAAYYCKLGCVLICGAIERSIEILISDRVGGRSAPQVNSFLKSFFKRGTNYNCDEIQDLLFKFDADWGRKFQVLIEKNDQIRSGVASCYAVRNSVAHGGGQSLGPNILRQYFDNAFTLVAGLENLLRA